MVTQTPPLDDRSPATPDGLDDNSTDRLLAAATEHLCKAIGVACEPSFLARSRELRAVCGIAPDDPLRPSSIGEIMRSRLLKAIDAMQVPPTDWRYNRMLVLSRVKRGLPMHLGLTNRARHVTSKVRREEALTVYQESRYTEHTMRRDGMLEYVLVRHLITQMLNIVDDEPDSDAA